MAVRIGPWISILALLLSWSSLACRPDPDPGAPQAPRQLAGALGGLRLMEPRISGGYAYAPCTAPSCPPGQLCESRCAPVPRLRQHISTASLSLLAQAHTGSVEERHTRALATLILDREETDAAVEILESLRDEQPQNPLVLNDLGAAYLVRAQRQNRASDVPQALEVLAQAIDIDWNLAEARFNRALALETLLPGKALTAWGEFAASAKSGDPGWVAEAQERAVRSTASIPPAWPDQEKAIRAALRADQEEWLRSLVSTQRVRVRLWAEQDLLPSWGNAVVNGDTVQAAERLSRVESLAGVLQELTGDQLLEESIAVISAATETVAQPRLRSLAAGHRTFRQALDAYKASNAEAALALYRAAFRALAKGGSPFQYWAQEGEIVSLFQLQRLDEAESLVHQLLSKLSDRPWPALTARLTRLSALFLAQRGHPLEALREYETALQQYDAIGERELWLSTQSRRSDVLRTLGTEEEAWRSRLLTLGSLQQMSVPVDRYFVLHEASQAALEAGLLTTARTLIDQAFEVAKDENQPLLAPIALRYRAEIHLRAGDLEAATRDLKEARQAVGALSDETVKRVLLARIQKTEGMTLSGQDPEAAIIAFRNALDGLPTGESLDLRAELRYLWAQCLRQEKREGAAEEQLYLAIQHQEALWQSFLAAPGQGAAQEEITFSYFDYQAKIRDLLIELLAHRGAYDEALRVLEWSKAREPLERLARINPKLRLHPLNREEILVAVPNGTTLFQYLVQEDHIKVWRLRQGELLFRRVPISRRQLRAWNRAIQSYTQDPSQEAAIRDVLSQYRLALLPSGLDDLRPQDYLVFIPHQEIHGAPFAALLDGQGRFLVENHPILGAPSLTLFVSTQTPRPISSSARISTLLVGDPAFDPRLFTGLPRLPGALGEVERLAEIYPDSLRLLGSRATAAEFLRRLPEAKVVHFAGHALLNSNNPSRTFLALASSAEHEGVLYAEELMPLQLHHTRLVVLSACTTTGGYPIGSLGVSGLVRPFLGAGVPAVVASLWDVRDGASTKFFSDFHRRLQEGLDAATALQEAQIALLHHGNGGLRSISSWAAYSLTGNVRPFQKISLPSEREPK